jgi:DNA-binding NtrC family response regulator
MPKILIFSQDNRLGNALSELLKNNSYSVLLFSEEKKAIKSIREVPYDLIFIDFPQNNKINHELLSSIHFFHELLPIIVITDADKISIAENAI